MQLIFLYVSLTGLLCMFLFNAFICAKATTHIQNMQQPGYKQPVVPGRYQIAADIQNLKAQQRVTITNVVLSAITMFPLLLLFVL